MGNSIYLLSPPSIWISFSSLLLISYENKNTACRATTHRKTIIFSLNAGRNASSNSKKFKTNTNMIYIAIHSKMDVEDIPAA